MSRDTTQWRIEKIANRMKKDPDYFPPQCEATLDDLRNKILDFVVKHSPYKPAILAADDPDLELFSFVCYYVDEHNKEIVQRYSIEAEKTDFNEVKKLREQCSTLSYKDVVPPRPAKPSCLEEVRMLANRYRID